MRVYLIRHGEAKSKAEDRDRSLSDRGRDESRKMAAFLTPLGLGVRAVWHSGKTRAAQTAEILAAAVHSDEGVVPRAGLAPLDDVRPVADKIERAQADLMIVGHLPFLAKLAAVLLTGQEAPEPVAFACSGAVCLERDDDTPWHLRWAVPPDLLFIRSCPA